MSDSIHFLDIIFFAMVAAFLVLRLRNVLGRRTGEERPPTEWPPRNDAKDNVIDIATARKPAAVDIPLDSGDGDGVGAIKAADPTFSAEGFLAGARSAFQMIVSAFASGDKTTLRPLLSDEVYRNFAAAIDQRMAAGETLETELLTIKSATIGDCGQHGTLAHITIRFVSEQVNVVRDAQGVVKEGDPQRISDVIDEWTFQRDVRSPDPNWHLVATHSPEA